MAPFLRFFYTDWANDMTALSGLKAEMIAPDWNPDEFLSAPAAVAYAVRKGSGDMEGPDLASRIQAEYARTLCPKTTGFSGDLQVIVQQGNLVVYLF